MTPDPDVPAPLSSSWPAPELILKLTGRRPPTIADHAAFGATRVPLLS